MKVYGINGCGASGKTTFENYVKEYAEKNNAKVNITSIIDYVKWCAVRCGWSGAKSDKDRRFLSDLKLALEHWNDSPRDNIKYLLKRLEADGADVVFVDIREEHDMNWLKENFNAKSILVDRGIERSYGNVADDNVKNMVYDIVIDNTGTLDTLKETAQTFWERIVKDDN